MHVIFALFLTFYFVTYAHRIGIDVNAVMDSQLVSRCAALRRVSWYIRRERIKARERDRPRRNENFARVIRKTSYNNILSIFFARLNSRLSLPPFSLFLIALTLTDGTLGVILHVAHILTQFIYKWWQWRSSSKSPILVRRSATPWDFKALTLFALQDRG